jgi:rare lipoprotein A
MSRGAALAFAGLSLAACASGPRYPAPSASGYGGMADNGSRPPSHYPHNGTSKPYQINGRWYYPAEQPDYDEVGLASWYGDQFHNHYTADGEVFDMNLMSAAHKTLPLPCLVEVTNLANGRKMVVRVNDRGPFIDGRIIDLSKAAAKELGFYGQGVTQVRVRYVGPAPDLPRVYQVDNAAPASRMAPPRGSYAPTQVATTSPILGGEIQDRPLHESPSQTTWTPPPEVPSAAPPTPVTQQTLPPLSEVHTAEVAPPGSAADIDALLASLSDGTPQTAAIQAGAYANRASAERAAAALSGPTQIVPTRRNGQTVYKVMLDR